MGISAGTGAQSWGIQVCDTGDGSNTLHLNARGGFVGINKVAGNVASYELDVTGDSRITGVANSGGVSTGAISASQLSLGGVLTSTTQKIRNSQGGFATMVQKVQGAAGGFSQLVICVNLLGAGGYGYIINTGGTSGGVFQAGGGYTNGLINFSHSAPVGGGFTVTCHSCTGTENIIRFVGGGGVHPFASIQMFGSLQQDFDDTHIYIDYR
jgi:hypothetical protein